MNLMFRTILLLLCLLFVSTELKAQSRKDLIWEYKKMLRNADYLGIRLPERVENYSNQEIQAVLDRAWKKKEIILLLQNLKRLENPSCRIIYFEDILIDEVVRAYLADPNNDIALNLNPDLRNTLFDAYLNNQIDKQLPALISAAGLVYDRLDILLLAYKRSLEVQLWVRSRQSGAEYTYLKSVHITDPIVSNLGPKSKLGDQLTPEGIYRLFFYPSFRWSDFYLAFRIDYPNQADLIRRRFWGISEKAGGDINLHGCCISIGCIPIGNPDMIELFFLIRANQKNGNNVRIAIFPDKTGRFQDSTIWHETEKNEPRLIKFWQSLLKIDREFHSTARFPGYIIDQRTGYYRIGTGNYSQDER